MDIMDKTLRALLQEHKVHYNTQITIHNAGYQSLWEFADMFVDKAACRAQCARTFGFRNGDAGLTSSTTWDTPNTNINCMRVANAMDEAAARAKLQRDIMRGSTDGPPSS